MELPQDCLNVIIGFIDAKCLAPFAAVCKDWRAAVEAAPVTIEHISTTKWFVTLKVTTAKFSGNMLTSQLNDGFMSFAFMDGIHVIEFFDKAISQDHMWARRETLISGVYVSRTILPVVFTSKGLIPLLLKNIIAAYRAANLYN